MTKQELREKLMSGQILDELFHFTRGQECLIFKADKFCAGDEIIYIPDIDLNEIPVDTNLSVDNSMMDELNRGWGPMTAQEQINLALSFCYTGDDFVDECGGDVEKAERLFWYCDWQHPSSAVDELDDDEDDFDLDNAQIKTEQIVRRLLSDNEQNIETATGGYDSGYAEGYHDALVDVMNQMGIPHNEEYYD